MSNILFAFIIVIHGLIHMIGFLKGFNLATVNQLLVPISHLAGAEWLVSGVLFLFSAIMLIVGKNWWGFVALPAVMLSQTLMVLSWSDAKFGTVPNLLILLVAIVSIGSFFMQSRFNAFVRSDFTNNNTGSIEVLTENDIAHLPAPVQAYLAYTGVIGKSRPKNMYLEFDAEMYQKPGDTPMNAHSVQYNFYGDYARFFLMKATKAGIPFSAMHVYKDKQASFQVKLAELFNVVNIRNEELTIAETVTLLNDMCIFTPGSLIDKRLSWEEIDSRSTRVTLTNGKYVVSAILYFNELGELIHFISDDRAALQDDGTMKQVRWTTPVSDYKEFEGRKIPTVGKTIWSYPEGDFMYGAFHNK